MEVCQFANQSGIQKCVDFNPALLIPEERVRGYCVQNRCGNYGQSYMCPPLVPPLDIIKTRLQKYHSGILLQYWVKLDVKSDWKSIRQSMVDFHKKIVEVEEFLKGRCIKQVWGITAGTCAQCEVCRAKSKKPCLHPDTARASMEALGIDVIALLTNLGLDNQFHTDKVTWTGCVLF